MYSVIKHLSVLFCNAFHSHNLENELFALKVCCVIMCLHPSTTLSTAHVQVLVSDSSHGEIIYFKCLFQKHTLSKNLKTIVKQISLSLSRKKGQMSLKTSIAEHILIGGLHYSGLLNCLNNCSDTHLQKQRTPNMSKRENFPFCFGKSIQLLCEVNLESSLHIK